MTRITPTLTLTLTATLTLTLTLALTQVRFGYCDAWPRNMDEEPCALQYEDGDKTVPVRSMVEVCEAWQQQRACFAPLATAYPAKYRSRGSDCVAIEYLHCRDPGMSSKEMPGPGAAHCPEYHATILHKKVRSTAVEPRQWVGGSRLEVSVSSRYHVTRE